MFSFNSYDCETYVRDDTGTPPMVCGQFYNPKRGAKILLREESLDDLEALLLDPKEALIGANIAFDLAVAINHRPRLRPLVFAAYKDGRIYDILVRQRLLNIRNGGIDFIRMGKRYAKAEYGLGGLAKFYLGKKQAKESKKDKSSPRFRFHEVDGIPVDQWPQEFRDYAEGDVFDPVAIFKLQSQQVRAKCKSPFRVSPDEVMQTEAAWCLHLEAVEGIKVNAKRLAQVERKLNRRRARRAVLLHEAGLLKYKAKTKPEKGFSATQKEVQKLVEQAFPEGPPLTDTGRTSISGETLDKAAARLLGDSKKKTHILVTFKDYKKDEKTLGYLKSLKEGTSHRLHSHPNVLVATGRTSWAKPNLQQLPRVAGLRECIEAPDGYVIASCDYDSLELRSLAQCLLELTGSSVLASKYQEDPNFDPHSSLAAQIMGISYEEGLRLKKAKDKKFKDMRQMCKAANFGYPGGMGVEKFLLYAYQSYGVALSYAQAEKLRDDWFTANPEMRRYFDIISSLRGGELKQLYSNRIRGRIGFCDGANSFFQGLAADGAKMALILITRACYVDEDSPLYGSRPVVFVHDENILYVPEEKASEAGKELARLMVVGMRKLIKDVPVTCETALSRIWSKDAEPVYAANGDLEIWEAKAA